MFKKKRVATRDNQAVTKRFLLVIEWLQIVNERIHLLLLDSFA